LFFPVARVAKAQSCFFYTSQLGWGRGVARMFRVACELTAVGPILQKKGDPMIALFHFPGVSLGGPIAQYFEKL
jgi:hypothetical protein